LNHIVVLTRIWKKSGYSGIASTTRCTGVSPGRGLGTTRQ